MIMYKLLGANGAADYEAAETLDMAQAMAIVTYGPGSTARESFYGEWKCGLACGYDDDGNHYKVTENGSRDYGSELLNKKFG